MCSHAALLAHGDGLRQRLPGCLRHGLDGKQLGSGSDSAGSAGREVHTLNMSLKYAFVCLDIYVIRYLFRNNTVCIVSFCLFCYRESIYRLLPQTTPENIAKNFDQYTVDPGTRYPNLNSSCVRTHQVTLLTTIHPLSQCTQGLECLDFLKVFPFHSFSGASLVHQQRAESLLSGTCRNHTSTCQSLQTK